MGIPLEISVVIPALNEEKMIARAIESAWNAGVAEVVVSDGGSSDQTCEIAAARGAEVTEGAAGRGNQLNRGAARATSELLPFLHADNWLSPACCVQLWEAYQDGQEYCCFRQEIDAPGLIYRWIEKGNAIRAAWQNLPYGDQGISLSRTLFEAVGGFDDIPLMEDVALARRLSGRAIPRLLPGPLHVSERRWKKKGPIRLTISNWVTMLRYRLGTDPRILAKGYPPDDEPLTTGH